LGDFRSLNPIVPNWSIAAAKTDAFVQPVENFCNPVDKLWITWGKALNNLWKHCGFRGEKFRQ
jgi:hypothetical protein